MPVQTVRGGVPRVQRLTIDTTGREVPLPFYSLHVKIRVLTNPCQLYFTPESFGGGADYVLIPIPAAETPYGEWEGPVEAQSLWLKGVGGNSTVELVAFQRRG